MSHKGYIKFFGFSLNKKDLNIPGLRAPAELELLNIKWRNLEYFRCQELVKNRVNRIFNPYFILKESYYDEIGYFVFKFILLAVKPGVIDSWQQELGTEIRVKEKDDFTTNEIRKNNLLYERTNYLEVRIDDYLLFYITHGN